MTRRSFDSALWSLRVRTSASPAAACARARVARALGLRFYLCSFQKRKISFKTACFLVRVLCRLRIFESMLQKRKDSCRKWQIPCVMRHISSKNATDDRIRQISRLCKDHFCVFAQIPSENAKYSSKRSAFWCACSADCVFLKACSKNARILTGNGRFLA